MSYALEVRKVLWITLLLNITSALVKIVYGFYNGIGSMQADGFHSFFDGTSNIIGLIGIWLSSMPPDERHHYGHRKFETMATIGISVLLFLTCIEILRNAVSGFKDPRPISAGDFSFAVVFFTIGINIFVATYERLKGKALKSDFLIADSRHTLSDIYASSAVLVSLIALRMGYSIVDPIASLIIAVMIGRLGYEILKEASDVLTDASPIMGEDLTKIENIALSIKGVRGCHKIRVRGRNDAVHIDCHILVCPDMSMSQAHDIAHMVEERIKSVMSEVVDVIVHLEPED